MSRLDVAVVVLFVIAVSNTVLLGLEFGLVPCAAPSCPAQTSILVSLLPISQLTTPLSWVAVVGVWTWRRRARSIWKDHGLSKDLFELSLRMKGSPTRVSILRALANPKDRLQLSTELGFDWKTIDYHAQVLLRNGLIQEQSAYGPVKMYSLTNDGIILLKAIDELAQSKGMVESANSG